MTVDRSKCSLCGGESTFTTETGHAACDHCARRYGPPGTVLAGLLDEVEAHLRRFVVFPSIHGAVAVTLWVAATHIVDTLDVAPYLLVTAPEIESGKTRLMEIAAPLVHQPMFSSSMTPAVLFRTIDQKHPTLFLDEADNLWTKHGDDKNVELVALLNAGHRRGIPAYRMGGPGKTTLQEFDVFCPKAIAGAFPDVTKIPEALRSRSVHLRMQRKLPGEKVNRWTRQAREVWLPQLDELREELAGMLEATHPVDAVIEPLDELGDRDFDVWEPLLQIASRAGDRWMRVAVEAAIAMCGPDPTQTVPHRLLVLRDIEEVWNGEAWMLTNDILEALHGMEERPWGDYYGTPLTAHRLAKFLGSYGIESKREPGESRRKCYHRTDLDDLFARYGSASFQTVQSVQNVTTETSESNETSSQDYSEPGVHNGDYCRCGRQLDHYTKDGFPYCDDCRPPDDVEKRPWTLDEVLRVFGPSEE